MPPINPPPKKHRKNIASLRPSAIAQETRVSKIQKRIDQLRKEAPRTLQWGLRFCEMEMGQKLKCSLVKT